MCDIIHCLWCGAVRQLRSNLLWYVTAYDMAEMYRRWELNCCLHLDGALDGTFKTGATV